MTNYEIIMTNDATMDLYTIRNYIAETLGVPDVAKAYIKYIYSDISKLKTAPKRHPVLDDEPWKSRHIRRFRSKNFLIYYYLDEKNKSVYILNIVYNKRDQLKALSGIEEDASDEFNNDN